MDKSNWSLIFERPKRREEKREGEKEKKKKRKRKKKKKREEEEEENQAKVWIHDFCMDSMIFGIDFTWKARILWLLSCPKPRVC